MSDALHSPPSRLMIHHNTKHHPPSSESVVAAHERVRAETRNFMTAILENVPHQCRERSLALTKAEEAMMWANAAIARRQNDSVGDED